MEATCSHCTPTVSRVLRDAVQVWQCGELEHSGRVCAKCGDDAQCAVEVVEFMRALGTVFRLRCAKYSVLGLSGAFPFKQVQNELTAVEIDNFIGICTMGTLILMPSACSLSVSCCQRPFTMNDRIYLHGQTGRDAAAGARCDFGGL